MLAPPETWTAAEGRQAGESVMSAGTSSNLTAKPAGSSVSSSGDTASTLPESRRGSTRGASI